MTAEPRELIISVDQQGKFFLDAKEIAADELREVLRRAVADNPVKQSVIIRGDRRVEFQFVVTVMDLCNQAGITDYSVTIEGGS
jgi:biopolymer transport protein ExbD